MSDPSTTESPVKKPAKKAGGAVPAAITKLLDSQGIGKPVALFRTGTRIDGGKWFVGSSVWVAVMEDRLVLLADGPRNFVQQIPHPELNKSFYSLVSGELVCLPAIQLEEVRSLKMSTEQAREVLTTIKAQLRLLRHRHKDENQSALKSD